MNSAIQDLVAEFRFSVNRSFRTSGRITIPSRVASSLKNIGLTKPVEMRASYRGSDAVPAFLRSGLRAGGRYWQVRFRAVGNARELPLDSILTVRIWNGEGGWLLEVE